MVSISLFAGLVGIAVMLLFVAVWRLAAPRDAALQRLADYGGTVPADDLAMLSRPAGRFAGLNRTLARLGWGDRLAELLAQADVPMTAAEYALIAGGIGLAGLLVGTVRLNIFVGIAFAALWIYLSILYLRTRRNRRKRALSDQLPDVLTLLTGALRAGYGFAQAIEVVAERMPSPSCDEYRRVLRAMSLGVPLQRALNDMARRIDNDDVDLVVTAINVQSELGGNLAQVLDTIGQTIRERIRILREVRVLTAQQRLTGYIIAALPIFLAVIIAIIQPGYFDPFFEPGLVRLLPITAVVLMIIGFFLIRRIVDIEV